MGETNKQQEFSRGSVPETATVSGWSIGLLFMGIAVSLPCFVVGAELGARYGLPLTSRAVAVGTLILTLIACFTGAVGQRCRLSTAMIIQTAFGRLGAKAINLVLALTILGWFGVITKLFGESLAEAALSSGLADMDPRIFMVLGGSLIILTTIFGFSGIRTVSKVITPFLVMGLFATAYLAARMISKTQLMATPLDVPPLGIGISIVVGAFGVGVTIFPDFCRFAKGRMDAGIAALLGISIAVPVTFLLSAIPSIATGESQLTIILTSLGLGLPALAIIVCSAWTANASNLYSSSLALAAVAPVVPHKLLITGAGGVGILMAIFGISDYLIPFLTLLGITIPPIAGIYVADFFLVRRAVYMDQNIKSLPTLRLSAVIAWATGVAAGALSASYLLKLSGIPVIDSVVTALCIYMLISKLPLRRGIPA